MTTELEGHILLPHLAFSQTLSVLARFEKVWQVALNLPFPVPGSAHVDVYMTGSIFGGTFRLE